MKKSHLILALLLLAVTAQLVAQMQTTPTPQKPSQILFDFRAQRGSE